jgi:hypothetical protein
MIHGGASLLLSAFYRVISGKVMDGIGDLPENPGTAEPGSKIICGRLKDWRRVATRHDR